MASAAVLTRRGQASQKNIRKNFLREIKELQAAYNQETLTNIRHIEQQRIAEILNKANRGSKTLPKQKELEKRSANLVANLSKNPPELSAGLQKKVDGIINKYLNTESERTKSKIFDAIIILNFITKGNPYTERLTFRELINETKLRFLSRLKEFNITIYYRLETYTNALKLLTNSITNPLSIATSLSRMYDNLQDGCNALGHGCLNPGDISFLFLYLNKMLKEYKIYPRNQPQFSEEICQIFYSGSRKGKGERRSKLVQKRTGHLSTTNNSKKYFTPKRRRRKIRPPERQNSNSQNSNSQRWGLLNFNTSSESEEEAEPAPAAEEEAEPAPAAEEEVEAATEAAAAAEVGSAAELAPEPAPAAEPAPELEVGPAKRRGGRINFKKSKSRRKQKRKTKKNYKKKLNKRNVSKK